jgi:endonuclease I
MRCILLALLLLTARVFADPPPGYYAAATGLSGAPLKSALNGIIKNGHTVIPYADILDPLRTLWESPSDSTKIRLIYAGTPVSKTSFSWNREHTWPRSLGVNPGGNSVGGPDDSDLHHIAPCDSDVNSDRSNKFYDFSNPADGGFGIPPEAPLCTEDSNSWEPPVNERGDIARGLFYMAVRYDGTEPNTVDLELVNGPPGSSQMAKLNTLLAWHEADPPDATEMARNDLIFSAYQHNRNPFIDHPEWVASIFGTSGAQSVQVYPGIANAYESPLTSATWIIALSTAAPVGGQSVAFTISGTATTDDYTLTGTNGAGVVTIPAGATTATVTLTPTLLGGTEPAETVIFTATPNAAYSVIGGPATLTISDVNAPPASSGVLVGWNFDITPFSSTILSSSGSGTISTAGWGGSVTNFGGVSGQSLALVGSSGNNTFIELSFSATGWTNLAIQYQTRWSSTSAFNTHTWQWSTDGTNFTAIPGNYGPTNGPTGNVEFVARAVDMTGIAALRNAGSVKLRLYLSGASGSSNNRIDDLVITGVRYSSAWLAQYALGGASGGKSADADSDGLSNFAEWAFDSNPLSGTAAPISATGTVQAPDPNDGGALKSFPTISFTRRTDAAGLTYSAEQSTDLSDWDSGTVLVSTTPVPGSQRETVVFRSSIPIRGNGSTPRVFLRVVCSEP